MIDWLANKLDKLIIKIKQQISYVNVPSEYNGGVFTTPPISTQLRSPERYSTQVIAPSSMPNPEYIVKIKN